MKINNIIAIITETTRVESTMTLKIKNVWTWMFTYSFFNLSGHQKRLIFHTLFYTVKNSHWQKKKIEKLIFQSIFLCSSNQNLFTICVIWSVNYNMLRNIILPGTASSQSSFITETWLRRGIKVKRQKGLDRSLIKRNIKSE